MKIFGIGLNKTGTSTLREALQVLGFKNLASVQPQLIRQIRNNDFRETYRIIDENDGFEDLPWAALYKHIDKNVPDAKFILTIRKSPLQWFESLSAHSYKIGPSGTHQLFYGFYNLWLSRTHLIYLYNAHLKAVQSYFKDRPDKLLTVCWEDSDGWEKFCGFLGKEIPDVPFPHINKRSDRKKTSYSWINLCKSLLVDIRDYKKSKRDNFMNFKCYQE